MSLFVSAHKLVYVSVKITSRRPCRGGDGLERMVHFVSPSSDQQRLQGGELFVDANLLVAQINYNADTFLVPGLGVRWNGSSLPQFPGGFDPMTGCDLFVSKI